MASKRKVDIRKLVNDASANELRNFLIQLAEEKPDVRRLLVSALSPESGNAHMAKLKALVDAVVDRYGNGRGFVHWEETEDLEYELDSVLEEHAQALIQGKRYKTAFDFICYVFQTFGEIDTEDGDDCGFEMVADTCDKLWRELLPLCTEEERMAMLPWFLNYPNAAYALRHLVDYTVDIVMTQFHEEPVLRQNLQNLDSWIDAELEAKSELCRSDSLRRYVLYRLQIMQELGFPQEEIRAYRTRFLRFEEVRQQAVDDALARGENEQALALLLEYKKTAVRNNCFRSGFLTQLVALYKRMGRMEEYKAELVAYAMAIPEMEKFMELKTVCTEPEWADYREKLIAAHRHSWLSLELMQAEGLYERLLQEVGKDRTLDKLWQYETCLKEHFPEQVRDLHIRSLQKDMLQASTRSAYKSLAKHLQHVGTIPTGKAAAKALANEWKTTYRNRPALLDELRQAGF